MVMAPAHGQAAEWVAVRPTPPDPHTHPGRAPANPCPRQPQPSRTAFPAPDHRPPLARVKLVRPRPRPDGRYRYGRSSLTRGRAADPEHGSCQESQHTNRPGNLQVTGAVQHALLTKGSPM